MNKTKVGKEGRKIINTIGKRTEKVIKSIVRYGYRYYVKILTIIIGTCPGEYKVAHYG